MMSNRRSCPRYGPSFIASVTEGFDDSGALGVMEVVPDVPFRRWNVEARSSAA